MRPGQIKVLGGENGWLFLVQRRVASEIKRHVTPGSAASWWGSRLPARSRHRGVFLLVSGSMHRAVRKLESGSSCNPSPRPPPAGVRHSSQINPEAATKPTRHASICLDIVVDGMSSIAVAFSVIQRQFTVLSCCALVCFFVRLDGQSFSNNITYQRKARGITCFLQNALLRRSPVGSRSLYSIGTKRTAVSLSRRPPRTPYARATEPCNTCLTTACYIR